MHPRQTTAYLIRRFEEVGIEPVRRYGQNFLIDLNLLAILADAAQVTPDDVILEVGTGTGSLTALMAERAASVITVEIDPRLHQLASEQVGDLPNVIMLQQDALKNKNQMHPLVIEKVCQQLNKTPNGRLKLVSNLPFSVATPIITNMLACEVVPEQMVITIQRELADRIVASPGTKDYGALSVWVQSQCDAEILRVLSPSVFWPRPQVESAFVRITLNPAKRSRIEDLKYFHTFVRSMFFHRRKILRSELLSAFKNQLDKPAVDQLLDELQLPADARAEQFTPDGMLILCEAVRARGATVSL